MLPLLRLTQQEFVQSIVERLSKGRIHAGLLYSEWYRQGTLLGRDRAFANASRLRDAIVAQIDVGVPPCDRQIVEGETTKFLLSIEGGLETESVLIPMGAGWTLCISSQVGCRMGCAFCETARMGLIRNLTAQEIVAQVWVAQHVLGFEVRNIVFMGMGEPFDNYEEVMRAVRVMTDPAGLGFAPRNLTISTCGRIDGIRRLITDADPSLNLAVSVNAPSDGVRAKLMPVNRQYDMVALRTAMVEYCAHPRRQILIEYVLLAGVNDSLEAATQLADYLRDLPCKINVIPYNSQRRGHFERPNDSQLDLFVAALRSEGFRVTVRGTKGQGIMAACGQLGNRHLRRQREAV